MQSSQKSPFGIAFGVFSILFSASVTHADVHTRRALQSLFESRFASHYEPGRCGLNIEGLVAEAARLELAVGDGEVVVIENQGGSVFGMVNVEKARQSGRRIPGSSSASPQFEPGERNWYHHVIFVYDGYVYDFDYLNDPTVEPVRVYFDRMFFDEQRVPGEAWRYVGRDEKMDTYRLEVVRADQYLSALSRRANPAGKREVLLRAFLEQH